MQIRTFAQSDLGRSRSVNEDFYLVDELEHLFVVADGMGGHGNGEIASRIAVHAMARHLRSNPFGPRPWSRRDRSVLDSDRLREAVKAANREVLAEVEKDGSLAGMGATIVALAVDDNDALIAHVGDSRAYRLRDGELEQLTEDHSWVHEQVAAGLLSEDDARAHPFRSVVTRAVGGAEDVSVDIVPIELCAGDRMLLCSDGLNAVLSDQQIKGCLQSQESIESVGGRLIEAANEGGGPDNITVLLLEAVSDRPEA